jgi:hypothetical protein
MTLPAFLDHLRARGYTVVTTKRGAKATCPGHDDTRPSLDVTEGREAAALQYLGDGKALMSVFHDERETIGPETDPNELVATANWKFWSLDLKTFDAQPIDDLGWHAGGVYGERVDGHYYLLVPSADYAETVAYRLSPTGNAEERWRTTGWSNRLFSLH